MEMPLRITFTGALNEDFTIPENLMLLVLLFGNGLEGDIRITGNTADAVAAARGLATGTGSCTPIEPPASSPLYRAGDECYVQFPSTHVFLDPQPTG